MRLATLFVALFLSFFGSIAGASAATVHINLSTQRMHVESSQGSFDWPVSTARSGYHTPRGSFAPTGFQRMHYSRKYHMSPMPYSIFFRGGYAIHGTGATGSLGRPASHGCVRLSPGNARLLYQLVQSEGGRISITGTPPGSTRFASGSRGRHYYASARNSALAYAPVRRQQQGVRSWQAFPTYFPDLGF
jgi:hypothetical protein